MKNDKLMKFLTYYIFAFIFGGIASMVDNHFLTTILFIGAIIIAVKGNYKEEKEAGSSWPKKILSIFVALVLSIFIFMLAFSRGLDKKDSIQNENINQTIQKVIKTDSNISKK